MSGEPLVVDLSHHNTVTSFDAIRAAGIVGVIHKATEGKTYSDEEFWDRRQAAEDAGLEWASYHFLKHGDVDLQMENFLQKVEPVAGERLVIDFEDDECTLDDLREAVAILLAYEPSVEVTVYSGHLIKELLGDERDELLARTSLWLAEYTDDAEPSGWPQATWPVWSLWQYTQEGALPGIQGACDLNYFNGPVDACYAWFDPDYSDAGDSPSLPGSKAVRIDVTDPDGVDLEIWVNGQRIV